MPRTPPADATPRPPTRPRPRPHGSRPGPARPTPRRAVGVDPALKAAHRRQLRRIEGQVRGVAAMIEAHRPCAEIIAQVAAVRESLLTVARNLMRTHLTHCAAAAMRGDPRRRRAMTEEILQLVDRLSR
jgi:DNA-binding FrmR family transcriptional regulator